MSASNAEIVRDAYLAINRGDMGAFLKLVDPEIEWRGPDHGTDPDTYAGHTGVGRYYETRHDVWDELTEHPDRILDAGDQVVTIVSTRAKGKASGIVVEERFAHLWELRDGKVIRFEVFENPLDALERAGIPADRLADQS